MQHQATARLPRYQHHYQANTGDACRQSMPSGTTHAPARTIRANTHCDQVRIDKRVPDVGKPDMGAVPDGRVPGRYARLTVTECRADCVRHPPRMGGVESCPLRDRCMSVRRRCNE